MEWSTQAFIYTFNEKSFKSFYICKTFKKNYKLVSLSILVVLIFVKVKKKKK